MALPPTVISAGPFYAGQAPVSAPAVMTAAPMGTLFDRIDKNHDGIITRSEFQQAAAYGGYMPQQMQTSIPQQMQTRNLNESAFGATWPTMAAAQPAAASSLPSDAYKDLLPPVDFKFYKDPNSITNAGFGGFGGFDNNFGSNPSMGGFGNSNLYGNLAPPPTYSAASAVPPAPPPALQEANRYDAEAAAHEARVRELEAQPHTASNLEASIQELLEGQESLRYELSQVKMQVAENNNNLEEYRREAHQQIQNHVSMQGPPPPHQGYYNEPPPQGQGWEMQGEPVPQQFMEPAQQYMASQTPRDLPAPLGYADNGQQQALGGMPMQSYPGRSLNGVDELSQSQAARNLGYSANEDLFSSWGATFHGHATKAATTVHGHATKALSSAMSSMGRGGAATN